MNGYTDNTNDRRRLNRYRILTVIGWGLVFTGMVGTLHCLYNGAGSLKAAEIGVVFLVSGAVVLGRRY